MNIQLTYYQRIGSENLQELVSRFYEEIKQDEVLKPMYPGDLEAAERRLYLFLVQYLGGPATYSERRGGHPRLRMRHQLFPIDQDARDRWLKCMSTAWKIRLWMMNHASFCGHILSIQPIFYAINRPAISNRL